MEKLFQIRPMIRSDIEEVVEMIQMYNAEHASCALRDFSSFFLNATKHNQQFLVACLNNKIVGCMGFQSDKDEDAKDVYWTTYLYVHPKYYQQRIGSRLSVEIEKRIRKIGGRKIYLDIGNAEDQSEAILFHTKHGYIKEGELIDYFRDGENKLIFGKTLR